MTDAQRRRYDELNRLLLWAEPEEFNALYEEYQQLSALEQKEYRERNYDDIHKYFQEHIEGKTWNDIDPDRWDFYSDWHKDVFGYRPRSVAFNEREV